jgi:hypothetical protein
MSQFTEKDQADWDEARERLLEWNEKYKDRFNHWKGSYYSAILAVCGIYIAMSTLTSDQGLATGTLRLLCVVFSVVCIGFTIRNLKEHIQIYKEIGFSDLPEHVSEVEQYVQNRQEDKKKNPERASVLGAFDRGIEVSFWLSTACVFIAYAIDYLALMPCSET